jgi:hypothetical protein
MVLTAVHDFSIIEEIVELSAINLVERHIQRKLGVGLE